MKPFIPAEVPISYTLNFQQVNLILKGMGKLMREETDGFYEQFRGTALTALANAEAWHKEAADKAQRLAKSTEITATQGVEK